MEERLNSMYKTIEELTKTIHDLQLKNDSLTTTVNELFSIIKVHETRIEALNTLVKIHHGAIDRQVKFNASQMMQNKSFAAAQTDMRAADQVRNDSDILLE